ncbi:hypothetical protein G6038_17965 [Rhodococcus sp. 14C212]|uniref:hypothetical protein n=1 Tax=Rhodococcus sp. 14C212 TaxID=2711209 RepID=UPI0013ECB734|nr:hypothetical protein [Rhodococcus sp. 14C212]NGP07331.1 hypothetical protein [Rhodococcus sp. 14C212]
MPLTPLSSAYAAPHPPAPFPPLNGVDDDTLIRLLGEIIPRPGDPFHLDTAGERLFHRLRPPLRGYAEAAANDREGATTSC